MLASELTIQDDFPPVSYDAWRTLVEGDLQGAPFEKKLVTNTYEGIHIQPVYTRKDLPGEHDPHGFPGSPPFVRGAWPPSTSLSSSDLRQEYADPDLVATNQAILADLAGGVTSLLLRLDTAACNGLDPDADSAATLAGQNGIMAYSVDDLDNVLAGVDLAAVGVALEAGAAFMPGAVLLAGLWQKRSLDLHRVRGAFNADPLATLAREGQLPTSTESALEMLADLATWTSQNCPNVTAVGVDTSPYHHAGATAVQDLAFGLATAVTYLRSMTSTGQNIDAAARQFLFRISLGTHHFLAIAKLRAARLLWYRVIDACGGPSAAGALRIHARISNRVLTHRDPSVNILRNTVGIFAAIVGGAEAITSLPLDQPGGLPDDFSRRVARNTLLILQEEAHLHRVIDPAGGSWFLDNMTDQLAEEAWSLFQQIESLGGMLAVLKTGWVHEQIDSAYTTRARDIARRKAGITGVSEFPNLAEQGLVTHQLDVTTLRKVASDRVRSVRSQDNSLLKLSSAESKTAAAVEAAVRDATIGQLAEALAFHNERTAIRPLEPKSFAEPFEQLRDATDSWQAKHGKRPRVFLANLGPVAHHTARANYSANFFEAGGFEVVTNNGFKDADTAASAFTNSGASIAVICSSDKSYPEIVPPVAAALKAAGARCVVLAGNPGDNETSWRSSGVDRFIFVKCDVIATLRDLLREEGVLSS